MRVSDEVLRYAERFPGARVVAVTKTADLPAIRAAYDLGYNAFGENRIQDALPKMDAFPLPVEWHFIGRLQSNKARKAVGRFALLHSLDTVRLASQLSAISLESELQTDCLLQINVSGELTKQGIEPEAVHQFVSDIRDLRGIRIRGLMTMAPHEVDPERTRPLFRQMRQLFDELARDSWPHLDLRYLSMGMSNDYRVALDEGANLIRVGSAIFLEE